jgi:hypothetical protein
MRLQVTDLVDGLIGGAVAAVLSGLPSTIHALVTRQSVVETVEAAGNVVLPASAPRPALVAAAVPVHLTMSFGWGAVLGLTLPERHTMAWGAFAGLAIAALDLGTVGRRRPLIRALPVLPQLQDHHVYGAVVGAVVGLQRSARRTADA